MNKIYIVHCWDGTKNDCWYPWLDEKISDSNNKVIRFNMPNTGTPKIEEWVKELDKQVDEIDSNTYFVGHSIGCQTIMRYLETKEVKRIGGILFVAPWLELLDEAVSDEESYNTAMPWLNTPIDFEKIKKFTNKITCIFSDDDYFVPINQKDKFKEVLGAKTIVVSGKGHISGEDNVFELNEIYDELINILKKKVLILSFSSNKVNEDSFIPNKKGLTFSCVEYFEQKIIESSNYVEHICINNKNIKRCLACGARGWGQCKDVHKCVIKDDFNDIYDYMSDFDVYIFITPVYFHEMSESAKTFFDRLKRCDAFNEKSNIKGKDIVCVACAGGSGSGTEETLNSFNTLNYFLNTNMIGSLASTKFNFENIKNEIDKIIKDKF